jgi:GNAT superfamily N-acetyltransferase
MRSESLGTAAAMLARKITFDRLNYYHVFEAYLDRPVVNRVPGNVVAAIQLYQGQRDLDRVAALLRSSRLTHDMLKERLDRGDVVGIAVHGGEAVGYSWMNLSGEHWGPDLGLTIRFGQEETLQYDSFVYSQARGTGLQFLMTVPIMERARSLGYRRALAYVNGLNTRSLRNQRSQGKAQIGTVWTMRLPGIQRSWNWALGEVKVIREEGSGKTLLITNGNRRHTSEQGSASELLSR